MIVGEQQRALLIRRRDNLHWEPPGGVLELDETIDAGQHLPRYPGSAEPDNAAQLGELRYAEARVSEHEVTSWLARWWRRLLPRSQARLIDEAAATAAPGAARLGDIEHVVILMQENRSFDQYFGTMSAVRGFSDPRAAVRDFGGTRYPVFDQFGYRPGSGPDPSGYLQPFRLVSDPPLKDGQTTNDIAHDWPTQHRSWHDGQLDQFVTAHLAADGAENGPLTMGYYTRQDLAFYYALGDAFTVCDGYFSSVMGPTDPNRVMAISGTIDPDGKAGGPVVETYFDRIPHYGTLSFQTMPERLQAAGISWKVYNHPLAELALSPLPYFKAFTDPCLTRWRARSTSGSRTRPRPPTPCRGRRAARRARRSRADRRVVSDRQRIGTDSHTRPCGMRALGPELRFITRQSYLFNQGSAR